MEQTASIRILWLFMKGSGAALLLWLGLHVLLASWAHYQTSRSQFLRHQLIATQVEINQLKELKHDQIALAEKVHLLFSLRAKNFYAVRLFNELVKRVPKAVSLDQVSRHQQMIMLEGQAASSFDLNQFMQNMTQTEVFSAPVLTGISAENNESSQRYFQLQLMEKG